MGLVRRLFALYCKFIVVCILKKHISGKIFVATMTMIMRVVVAVAVAVVIVS